MEKTIMEFIKKHANWILAFLVLMSFIFLFFTCGAYEYEGHLDYPSNGFQMIFGRQEQGYEIFGFSFLGFVLFLFLLGGIILPFANDKRIYYIETPILLLASILYLILPKLVNHNRQMVDELFKGQTALYFGLIFIILAFVLSLYIMIVELMSKKKAHNKE